MYILKQQMTRQGETLIESGAKINKRERERENSPKKNTGKKIKRERERTAKKIIQGRKLEAVFL